MDAGRSTDPIERLRGRKVHLVTFGCTFNRTDSGRLREVLETMGCAFVPPEEADVIVVNTCTVVGRTERRVLKTLERFRGRELCLMGCMARIQRDLLNPFSPFGVIGNEDLQKHGAPVGARLSDAVGAVRIAEGCSGRCSYCITRLARGDLRSHDAEAIANAVSALVKRGVYEIQLTAQDVAAWGMDRGEALPDLLDRLFDVEGDFAIRLGMMNPANLAPILDRLIPLLESERVFRFIHLPLQSGSDRILEAMHRGYTCREWLGMVRELRRRLPDLFLATDLIAGFPGEDEGDHLSSLEAVVEAEPEKVNVTRFSARPMTPAASMRDLPDRVKKERSRELNRVAESIYRRKNRQLLGSVHPATAVETVKPGTMVMRTPSYRSVVVPSFLPLGSHASVRLREDRTHFFIGEMVIDQ